MCTKVKSINPKSVIKTKYDVFIGCLDILPIAQLLCFYSDYYLLKTVTNPAETTSNFAGLDKRICLGPNTLKKELISYLSRVYRAFWERV